MTAYGSGIAYEILPMVERGLSSDWQNEKVRWAGVPLRLHLHRSTHAQVIRTDDAREAMRMCEISRRIRDDWAHCLTQRLRAFHCIITQNGLKLSCLV
jgi:hypothetical protein